MPSLRIVFALYLAAAMTGQLFSQVSADSVAPRVLIGVRFGPGQAPCSNPSADCSSPQAEAMLKTPRGEGPEWGFVDKNGTIVYAGFRMVLSFTGPTGWGYVDRERLNQNARCPNQELTGFEPCVLPQPIECGWALLSSNGHLIRSPHIFGGNFAPSIQEQLPAISDVGRISEGLAAAEFGGTEGACAILDHGKWGYVDETGHTAIAGPYDEAGPFSEGLAPVRLCLMCRGAWTFIDRRGVSIGIRFAKVWGFSEGLAPVSNGHGWGYADRNGRIVIAAAYKAAWPFSENLAATRLGGDIEEDGLDPNPADSDYRGLWGFIDRSGKVVIAHQFSRVGQFSEGLATACKTDPSHYIHCGAIDATGNTRIPFQYLTLTRFRNGVALARLPSHKRIFVNREGQPIAQDINGRPIEYDNARVFRDGVAAVEVDGKWGFIDMTGRIVVAPQFLDVAPDWPDDTSADDYEDYSWATGSLAEFIARIRH